MKTKTSGQGRPKGVPNKFTTSVRDAVKKAFDDLQGSKSANLKSWAEANPTDFYKIAAKLIPAQVEAEVSGAVEHFGTVEWIVKDSKPAD